jgi:hypothetical protein
MNTITFNLHSRKHGLCEVIIDKEDAHLLDGRAWHIQNNRRYVISKEWGGKKGIYLHRLVVKAPDDKLVDHINGNPLDNRKANLRVCTSQENIRNSQKRRGCLSKFKGVTRDARKNKLWRAQICIDGERKSLGYFYTEIEAAHAYAKAAKELFGEFANHNAPEVK